MKPALRLGLGVIVLIAGGASATTLLRAFGSGSTSTGGYVIATPCSAADQPDRNTTRFAISEDGKGGAAETDATNMVPADTNGLPDIILTDSRFPKNLRVSVGPNGQEANGGSFEPALSSDAQVVAFSSDATNLVVGGDSKAFRDVFVHDRATSTTARVSVRPDGTEPSGPSFDPAISANGRFVVFASSAPDILPKDQNGLTDVFRHDRVTGKTIRVSVSDTGGDPDGPSRHPVVSRTGNLVAFESDATNLFAQPDNFPFTDIVLRDIAQGTNRRLSVNVQGGEANGNSLLPALDSFARFCAFESDASDLIPNDGNAFVDVFLRDLSQQTTTRVSEPTGGGAADGDSGGAGVSRFGRVAFWSDATNLVPGDGNGWRDTFLFDPVAGDVARTSVAGDGTEATGPSFAPVISDQGRDVALLSDATNLFPNDLNSARDAILHRSAALDLALETSPLELKAGKTFQLTVRGGQPGMLVLVHAVFFNEMPVRIPLVRGTFDALGEYQGSWTFPPGISCNTITFLAFGILPSGKAGASNLRWNHVLP